MVTTKSKHNSFGSIKCICNNNNNTKNIINFTNNSSHNYAKVKHQQQHSTYKNNKTLKINLIIGIWCLLLHNVTIIQGAAVYTNVDFRSNPTFEPICNLQEEHFIESEGKESSLILEFNTASAGTQEKSCTRILSSPPNYGFIIRLILPKIRHNHHHQPSKNLENKENYASNNSDSKTQTFVDKLNTSLTAGLKTGRSCPLSIFSSHDPHTPQWRVDPCQLEDTAPEMEDPVRLFHGRVRIVWEHHNHTLNSKLMVTVLGKGDQCRSENKHQCLRIGDEPILCISKDLICDGIRHCPYSNEYDSDEDYTMCWKRSRLGEPIPPSMESDIFEHFALEVFRNLFAYDVPSIAKANSKPKVEMNNTTSANKTMLHKVPVSKHDKHHNDTQAEDLDTEKDATTIPIGKEKNSTGVTGGHHHRRNSTRMGVNSDLTKYGPWGYLMLGMVLCGGALLICGLWASASQHTAINNEREAALQSANAAAGLGQDNRSTTTSPPNYEELDPPPAYSVLFPNQKAASTNTLNSLEVTSSQPSLQQIHMQLSSSAAPSSRSTSRASAESASGSNPSTTTTTHNNN